MKFTFLHHQFEPKQLIELYEKDTSYFPLVEFVRKWIRGDHTFEVQTSGSTGTPKKVPIYRKQIEASVQNSSQRFELHAGEQLLYCLNPSYIAAVMMAARGLILDMDVNIVKPGSNPFKEIGDRKIDFASFVPYQIYQIIEDGQLELLSKIKNVLIGGAPIVDEVYRKLAKLPNNNFMTYGMTETVSHIAVMPIKGSPEQSKYQILPNVFIGTNDDQCLWIEGDVTNNARIQTADVVEITDDINFKWLGRRDHVINSGGIKIFPEQVEKIIQEELHKLGIRRSFYVTGKADNKLGEKLVLMVEGKDDIPDFLTKLSSSIETHLTKYHIPKEIKFVKQFEWTTSGKVKR